MLNFDILKETQSMTKSFSASSKFHYIFFSIYETSIKMTALLLISGLSVATVAEGAGIELGAVLRAMWVSNLSLFSLSGLRRGFTLPF